MQHNSELDPSLAFMCPPPPCRFRPFLLENITRKFAEYPLIPLHTDPYTRCHFSPMTDIHDCDYLLDQHIPTPDTHDIYQVLMITTAKQLLPDLTAASF